MGLTHTVSGDVAHFRTPSRVPIDSLKFHFLPKQASGTPSPENPIPIEGWTGLNGYNTQESMFDYKNLTIHAVGGDALYSWENNVLKIEVKNGTSAYNVLHQISIRWDVPEKLRGKSVIFFTKGLTNSNENHHGVIIAELRRSDGTLIIDPTVCSESNKSYKRKYTLTDDTAYCVFIFRMNQGASTTFSVGDYFTIDGFFANYPDSVTSDPKYSFRSIPITFPTTGKNKFLYNEDNIELGLPTEAGLIRTVVHTGVYGNGGNISISATAIDPEMVSNNSFNVGYIKDGVIHVLKSFISWIDGSVTNGTVIVPSGYEFVIIATTDSKWAVTRNIPRYNIQIEYSDAPTSYEPYSSDNTFYGGYIDPVAGEIVAEYAIDKSNGTYWGIGMGRVWQWYHDAGKPVSSYFNKNLCTHWINNKKVYYTQETTVNVNENGALCIGKDFFTDAGIDFDTITSETIEAYLTQLENSGTPFRVCYPLETPIHIPIAPQTMKAYLDHNNFWSDANDITEVSYEVTESKDIQAARKRFEAEEDGHHKLVRWNQRAPSIANGGWGPYDSTKTQVSISGDVLTRTMISSAGTFNSGAISTGVSTAWIKDHIYYYRYNLKSSVSGHYMAIVGNEWTTQISCNANEWAVIKAFKKSGVTSSGTGSIWTAYSVETLQIGDYAEVKDPILVDLTQMFGAGNEPTTAAEFERICALNGIDLTIYQPYDSGSDRWLIVP